MEKKANKNTGLLQTMADKFTRLFRREKQSAPPPAEQVPVIDPVSTTDADTQPTPLTSTSLETEAPLPEMEQDLLKPESLEVDLTLDSTETTSPEVDPKEADADASQQVLSEPQPKPQPGKKASVAARTSGQKRRLHISDLTHEEAQTLLENFVTEHLSDEMLSVETMASQLKVSRTGLYQLVHDNFEMTPANYIMSRRLEHACKLLAEGRKVREVSIKCGFSDPKYFSKVFKKSFGVLPSNYVG